MPLDLNFTRPRRRSQSWAACLPFCTRILLCNWQPASDGIPSPMRNTRRHARARTRTHVHMALPSFTVGFLPTGLGLAAHRHFACGFHDTTCPRGMKPEPLRRNPSYVYEPPRLWDSGIYITDWAQSPLYPDLLQPVLAVRATVRTVASPAWGRCASCRSERSIPAVRHAGTQDPSLLG